MGNQKELIVTSMARFKCKFCCRLWGFYFDSGQVRKIFLSNLNFSGRERLLTRSENTILTLNLNFGANITYKRKLTELLQTLRKSAGRKQALTRIRDMTSLEKYLSIEIHKRILLYFFLLKNFCFCLCF